MNNALITLTIRIFNQDKDIIKVVVKTEIKFKEMYRKWDLRIFL